MEAEQFTELSEKLDRMMKLLAVQAMGDKTITESIRRLSSLGFQPKEIAELTGTTPNTVRVFLSVMRKKGDMKWRRNKAKSLETQ